MEHLFNHYCNFSDGTYQALPFAVNILFYTILSREWGWSGRGGGGGGAMGDFLLK